MSNAYEILVTARHTRGAVSTHPHAHADNSSSRRDKIKNDSLRNFSRFLTHNWRRAGGTARQTMWTDIRGHCWGDEKLIRVDCLANWERLNSRHKSADDSRQPRRLSFADTDGQRRDEQSDGRRECAQPACEERFMTKINFQIADNFSSRLSHATSSEKISRRAFNYFSSD